MDTVIEFNKVAKKFCKNPRKIMSYGLSDIFQGIFALANPGKIRLDEFWALKEISFKIKKGEIWGIIGANGSGKSTLLKLLNGIFMPDKGEIKVKGRVGALIAAGAGFHPMLTGRENIYINGVILGMSKKEIDRQFDSIVEFAEIKNFLDTSVKNYSSGMYVRLGFSIAAYCLPEIMLVDEILSVGDARFQKKALKKMTELINNKKTIIFVSHNLKLISSFTEKCLYLKNGKVEKIGATSVVLKKYINDYEQNHN